MSKIRKANLLASVVWSLSFTKPDSYQISGNGRDKHLKTTRGSRRLVSTTTITLLGLLLSILGPSGVSAGPISDDVLLWTGVYSHCESGQVDLSYHNTGRIDLMTLSVHNSSSDDYEVIYVSPEDQANNPVTVHHSLHAIDKVVIDFTIGEVEVIEGISGTLYARYMADVGTCGQWVVPTLDWEYYSSSQGVPEDPNISITNFTYTCGTNGSISFDYSASRELIFYVSSANGYIGKSIGSFTGQAGTQTFAWDSSAGFVYINVVAFDLDNGYYEFRAFHSGELDCGAQPVEPVLEIHNTILACDGTVTFSVVDVNAIKSDSVAYVTLFHGATILDGPMQVQLSPGVTDYATQVKGSDEWPQDHLVRAQVSWAPETQSNGVVEPGACDAPSVDPTPTEPADNGDGDETAESMVVIELLGIDAAGSPFGAYTEAASNLPVGAYYTGTVSADNTITIPNLLPGTYRIVIDHAAQGLVSFTIAVDESAGDVLVLQVDLGEAEEPTVQPQPEEPTVQPDDSDEGSTAPISKPAEKVESLPSTGTGTDSQVTWVIAASLLAGLALTALGLRLKPQSD